MLQLHTVLQRTVWREFIGIDKVVNYECSPAPARKARALDEWMLYLTRTNHSYSGKCDLGKYLWTSVNSVTTELRI